jgi:hypothetical protein
MQFARMLGNGSSSALVVSKDEGSVIRNVTVS